MAVVPKCNCCRTADLGSSDGTFQPCDLLVSKLPTLAVLMAHFGHYIANFDGVPSELPLGGTKKSNKLGLDVPSSGLDLA